MIMSHACIFSSYSDVNFLLECVNYRTLVDGNRNKTHYIRSLPQQRRVNQSPPCDDQLSAGWYRFTRGAGNQMAESCVIGGHCGTDRPGWLSGIHPSVAEGAVKRTVCFYGPSGCCHYSTEISVRNCGGFYVYRLGKPPNVRCPFRYCGNGKFSKRGKSKFSIHANASFVGKYPRSTVESLVSDPAPREFRKAVSTSAGHLREWALVSGHMMKQ